MCKIETVLTLGVCLGLASPSFGGPEDIELVAARAPSEAAYPDQDAVILYEEVALTLHPDGRTERYTRHLRKYFTPYEVDGYSDPRIAFDSETQSLEILTWQTVLPSGGRVEKKDRAFNQVTPDLLGRAPDYAAVQEVVATHLGMEEGAVVEREYVVRDTVPQGDGLSGIEYFQSRLPVMEKVVKITVPAETELRFEALGGAPSHWTERGASTVTHFWRVSDVPGVPPESVEGRERDCQFLLVYSTVGSWEELVERWRNRIERCVGLTDRLEEELGEITREAQDEEERIRLIHEAVCRDVQTVTYPPAGVERRCRPAGVVYETGYGHRLDKGVLLLAWLEGAGVEAEPVLVSRSLRFARGVPCTAQVPELWVVAEGEGGAVWMDPIGSLESVSRKDLGGCTFLRFFGGAGLDGIFDGNAPDNVCHLKITASVDEDQNIEGECRVKRTGVFSPYYGVSGIGGEAEAYVDALASRVLGGVAPETFNFRKLSEEVVALGFRFRREPDPDDRGLVLELPCPAGEVEIPGFERGAARREAALVLPGAFVAGVDVEIELWEGAEVRRLPEAVSIEAPFGSYRVWCEEEGETLRFGGRMEMIRRRIEPAEYPEFRRMLLQGLNPARSSIVLARE